MFEPANRMPDHDDLLDLTNNDQPSVDEASALFSRLAAESELTQHTLTADADEDEEEMVRGNIHAFFDSILGHVAASATPFSLLASIAPELYRAAFVEALHQGVQADEAGAPFLRSRLMDRPGLWGAARPNPQSPMLQLLVALAVCEAEASADVQAACSLLAAASYAEGALAGRAAAYFELTAGGERFDTFELRAIGDPDLEGATGACDAVFDSSGCCVGFLLCGHAEVSELKEVVTEALNDPACAHFRFRQVEGVTPQVVHTRVRRCSHVDEFGEGEVGSVNVSFGVGELPVTVVWWPER